MLLVLKYEYQTETSARLLLAAKSHENGDKVCVLVKSFLMNQYTEVGRNGDVQMTM